MSESLGGDVCDLTYTVTVLFEFFLSLFVVSVPKTEVPPLSSSSFPIGNETDRKNGTDGRGR